MSGFDDDFGEMVGEKEAPNTAVEDVLVAEDPAAEFLAREQEQLGDLESEIGPLSGTTTYKTHSSFIHYGLLQFHPKRVQ